MDGGPGRPSFLRWVPKERRSVTPQGGARPLAVGSSHENEGGRSSSSTEVIEFASPSGMTQIPQQERQIDEEYVLRRDGWKAARLSLDACLLLARL